MRISLFTSYNKQERINLWGIIMIKTLFKHISKYYKDTFVLAIAGVAVGVLVGLVDAAFGLGLNTCTAIRTKYFWYLIWFLPLGGVFIWFIYHQFGKSVANGMKMVFHVGLGKNTKLPIRMVPLSVIGTWTTHLFGGSARRIFRTFLYSACCNLFCIGGIGCRKAGISCFDPSNSSFHQCSIYITGARTSEISY